ncbi:hypothetical protein NL676_016850 [Syzygium grande]|nr:hypothetical protein NL676_016850 [Syzygium grande]
MSERGSLRTGRRSELQRRLELEGLAELERFGTDEEEGEGDRSLYRREKRRVGLTAAGEDGCRCDCDTCAGEVRPFFGGGDRSAGPLGLRGAIPQVEPSGPEMALLCS